MRSRRGLSPALVVALGLAVAAVANAQQRDAADSERTWLAGDHHVHSQYSVLWDRDVDPPAPILRSHGIYPIPHNALMAKYHGLAWMVSTDHGGLDHAKLNVEQAYPDVLLARRAVPEVIHFFGVELNPPGADHASVIVAHTHEEANQVYQIESRFDRARGGPPFGGGGGSADDGRNSEARMIEALEFMNALAEKPLVIANHPSRTARTGQRYGLTTPAEFRAWNDAAPDVAVGMAGAPGHQATGLVPDGFDKRVGARGQYIGQLTLGGFDPMTARLGGLWDAMLGEGRHWWITANSDSHRHWTEGGNDFWPGEYSKTYVHAVRNHADILEALRAGRIFVTTGDLISELELTVEAASGRRSRGERTATAGGTLSFTPGTDLRVTIRLRDPEAPNFNGETPAVGRVDLIAGDINPRLMEAAEDVNPSTRVVRRFGPGDWTRAGEVLTMTHTLEDLDRPIYLRVRGTSTSELEPELDVLGEDPWADLWFYSNPVFVENP